MYFIKQIVKFKKSNLSATMGVVQLPPAALPTTTVATQRPIVGLGKADRFHSSIVLWLMEVN